MSYNKLGDILLAAGKLVGARDAFEHSPDIRKRLAEADLRDAVRQRDLSISFGRLAEALVAEAKLADAPKAFESSLEITNKLVEWDPTNAIFQNDLRWVQGRLARFEKVGRRQIVGTHSRSH